MENNYKDQISGGTVAGRCGTSTVWKFCPECGKKPEGQWQFCPFDGTSLRRPQQFGQVTGTSIVYGDGIVQKIG